MNEIMTQRGIYEILLEGNFKPENFKDEFCREPEKFAGDPDVYFFCF